MGIDCPAPRFGWQMDCGEPGARQSAWQIRVWGESGDMVWDSGKVESSVSVGIVYQGVPLEPAARYTFQVTVWDGEGACRQGEAWFETGLFPQSDAFEGAQWIGPREHTLCALAKPVFSLESRFCIMPGGSKAGLAFGANDPRLKNRWRNDYGLQGENGIAYLLDVSALPAKLEIYRVGYAPEDRKDRPFAQIELPLTCIGEKNRYQFHTLRVEVLGNRATAFLDDTQVDGFTSKMIMGTEMPPLQSDGRQLNPAGINDVTTYPLLCEIGFAAAPRTQALFEGICVRNVRRPRALLFSKKGEEKGIFPELPRQEGCFCLQGGEEGVWITVDPSHTSIPMLRRVFSVGKGLRKARLYATARGIYQGELNGSPLGEGWFHPGASQYDKHLFYQTYDVTGLVKEGKNAMGFILAPGWWNESQTFTLMNYNYWGDRQSFMAKLVLTYEDGTAQEVVTNETDWQWSGQGPVTYAGFFYGEHLDGRRVARFRGFSLPDYPANDWLSPEVLTPTVYREDEIPGILGKMWPAPNQTTPVLVGQIGAPVKVVKILTARERSQPKPGVYVYDMGQNMVGVPKITYRGGKEGQQLTIRYGEIRYPALEEYGDREGLILTENLRDGLSIDRWTLAGEEEEVFFPRFTFHGYRYVEITGVDTPPSPEQVQGVVLSSMGKLTGSFETSHPLVNRLWENVTWSQYGNFVSIPTDCPQRNERMGWAGDAQVFARTACYNAQVLRFYQRYLLALRDCQKSDGQYPCIAPIGGGFGGVAWESAGVIVTYEVYRQYGDLGLVEENYPSMVRYLEYLMGLEQEDGLIHKDGLGDWLASDLSTDGALIWNAIYCYDAKILGEMAEALGKDQDARKWRALFEKVRDAWNRVFVDPQTGRTRGTDQTPCDTQCAYALPLYYGIFLPPYQSLAASHLSRVSREVGDTVTTGFVGTAALNTALTQNGDGEEAYRLLMQTQYPSWLYSVTQGATTIWERWNSFTTEKGFGGNNSMNSFNHYSLGAVAAWMYEWVLGIQRHPRKAGFQQFCLRPVFGPLDYAKGYYDSLYGRIESGWHRENGQIFWECSLPANTSAQIYLPQGTVIRQEGDPLCPLEEEEGCCVWEARAGHYRFVIQPEAK